MYSDLSSSLLQEQENEARGEERGLPVLYPCGSRDISHSFYLARPLRGSSRFCFQVSQLKRITSAFPLLLVFMAHSRMTEPCSGKEEQEQEEKGQATAQLPPHPLYLTRENIFPLLSLLYSLRGD